MSLSVYHSLSLSLAPHFSLSKSRLHSLSVLIIGVITSRTVNLSLLANQFPGPAKQASNYRRLQRFFQYVRLDQAVVASLVLRMLDRRGSHYLALDRTNWQLGSKHINILMLALVTDRFRVPLLWSLLDHRGNSNSDQRIELVQHYIDLFGVSSIRMLLADREFIGRQWMDFLNENNIPFAIRVRQSMCFEVSGGAVCSIKTLLRHKKARRRVLLWTGRMQGAQTSITLAAKQIKGGQWLIIATNSDKPRLAPATYRKRWAIECLFGDVKTRGLNLEDTHLVDRQKLATLLAIVTLAITWSYRAAGKAMYHKAIRPKAHGRKEKSWFRTGLDILRANILNQPQTAITVWIDRCPKRKMRR